MNYMPHTSYLHSIRFKEVIKSNIQYRQVRRILDLDHNTSFPLLERSLKALDLELIVDVHKGA